MNFGIVKKSGAWFTFEEDRFQGREQFRQKLIEMPELLSKLEKEVKTKLGILTSNNNDKEEEKSAVKEKKGK